METTDREYSTFEEIENAFDLNAGTVKRLVKKFNVPFLTLGKRSLLSNEEFIQLLEKNTQQTKITRKKQAERMKQLHASGKLGKKAAKTAK